MRSPCATRQHRLFSFISQNWRAKPLVSYRVIVELISATTTKTGLTVRCQLDTGQYPSGIVVSDAEMAAINIQRAEFHGEWNYTISPKSRVYLVTGTYRWPEVTTGNRKNFSKCELVHTSPGRRVFLLTKTSVRHFRGQGDQGWMGASPLRNHPM